jgi:antitoxin VapB
MVRSKIFRDKGAQAVRLPTAVAFPDGVREVDIIKVGNSRVITPLGRRWDDFFRHGPPVLDDFLTERVDALPEEREPL